MPIAGDETGLTHIPTARDLASLLRSIVTGALAAPESTAVMVSMLEDQEIPTSARACRRARGSAPSPGG